MDADQDGHTGIFPFQKNMKMETPPGRVRRLGLSLNHKNRDRFFPNKKHPPTKAHDPWGGYIYLHLVDVYSKCKPIYHTWILWDINRYDPGLAGTSSNVMYTLWLFLWVGNVLALPHNDRCRVIRSSQRRGTLGQTK